MVEFHGVASLSCLEDTKFQKSLRVLWLLQSLSTFFNSVPWGVDVGLCCRCSSWCWAPQSAFYILSGCSFLWLFLSAEKRQFFWWGVRAALIWSSGSLGSYSKQRECVLFHVGEVCGIARSRCLMCCPSLLSSWCCLLALGSWGFWRFPAVEGTPLSSLVLPDSLT